ncbi:MULTISPECIES: hypothetical protein [Enterobacterales]|uniref:hypothetical protein n=1 Tax=Enterobacterales TaxID=91347 RepID=UPI002EDA340F
MSRDFRQAAEHNYNFTRMGSLGSFTPLDAQPLEFIMTSMKIEDIFNLSFAKDIQESKRDFDALIQRDIDEDRARKDICNYISPTEQKVNGVTFLPPLIVSIIEVDDNNNIQPFYPDLKVTLKPDEFDGTLLREWKGLFKITSYLDEANGAPFFIESLSDQKNIDINNAKLEMFIPSSGKGGRLVVIDGQHRLYALKHLRQYEKEKVKNVTVPVCIIYSPFSTQTMKQEISTFSDVPGVLRKLFVDINSTVEKVSGHYLTLLSDDNLGSVICREFCSSVLKDDKYGEYGLGVIEWNTKNHKESLTISRKHSTTSIGVLYSALEDNLSKSKGALAALNSILNLESIPKQISSSDLDLDNFDTDDVSEEYPWRDFQSISKVCLKEKINTEIVDGLKRIFFEPTSYLKSFEIYKNLVETKLKVIKENRDIYTECAEHIQNYYLKNQPIPKAQEVELKCKNKLAELNDWFTVERELQVDRIYFLSVFQKAYISAYIDWLKIFSGKEECVATRNDSFIKFANIVMDKDLSLFDSSMSYIQGTIYDGPKIRATKACIKQIKNLFLALLGNEKIVEALRADFGFDTKIASSLINLGLESGKKFFTSMKSDKEKSFAKNYKHNFNVSVESKLKLTEAEKARDMLIGTDSDQEKRLEANIDFENLIKNLVREDLIISLKALRSRLNYDDIIYLTYEEDSIDE